MKKKLLATTSLMLLTLGINGVVYAQSYNISSGQNSGALNFDENEFPSSVLNYPTQLQGTVYRSKFNETSSNRMFMHTFRFDVKKGCKVTAASFSMRVKAVSSASNDSYGFTNGGNSPGTGTVIFNAKVWTANDNPSQFKTITHNLASNPNILHTLNDGKFSVYVQDDTSVNSVRLTGRVTCPDNAGGPIDYKGRDHFQCYDIRPELVTKPVSITIQDQFGEDQVVLGRPTMLCNPSAKIHGKKRYNIIDKQRHLVCYNIVKQRGVKSRRVQINNQFEGNRVTTGQRKMFCAPSYKKHINDRPVKPSRPLQSMGAIRK